jgi:hypothetical protein
MRKIWEGKKYGGNWGSQKVEGCIASTPLVVCFRVLKLRGFSLGCFRWDTMYL